MDKVAKMTKLTSVKKNNSARKELAEYKYSQYSVSVLIDFI